MSEIFSGNGAIIASMAMAYIVFTGWLTVRLRSRTPEQFMTASRTMPPLVVGILMMSEFVGAKSTVGTAQEAFNSGMAAAWSVVGASIGFLLFGLVLVRRIYNSGEYTISAAISSRFGKSTTLTVSIIMILALLTVNVGNYVSGAAAIATALHMNLVTASFVIAAISCFYLIFGGMKGVAWVTMLHTGVKVIGLGIVLAVALSLTGGVQPVVENMPDFYFSWDGKLGLSTIFAWTFGTVGAIFSTQFIIQAVTSTPSARGAQRATFYAAAFCLPLGFVLAFIGVAAKFLYPDIKSLYALPVFIDHMPVYVAGFVTTALVASNFVSVCTVALAIASLVVRDFYAPMYKPSKEAELKVTRWLSLVIGLLPLIFVFFVPEILKLSFFTRALRLSITMVAMVGFFLPFFASNRGATVGLIVSALATTVWYLLGNPLGIDNMYIAAFCPLVIMGMERGLMSMTGARAPMAKNV